MEMQFYITTKSCLTPASSHVASLTHTHTHTQRERGQADTHIHMSALVSMPYTVTINKVIEG